MKRLLDTQNLRKINILSELSLNFENISVQQLAKKLDITAKTVLSTIDEINEDHPYININKLCKNELVLVMDPKTSIYSINIKYLRESIPYQILNDIFNNNFQNKNLLQLANSYHISITTLYRKFSIIKSLLNDFDIEFTPLNNPPIQGNEKQIRFFFFHFYWYSDSMFEWPFTDELKKICLSLYNNIFTDYFQIKSIIMKEKIILWLAIITIRKQLGYELHLSEIQEINDFIQLDLNYIPLKKQFNRHLSNFFYIKPIKFEECDFLLFYMTIICDEDGVFLPLAGSVKIKFEDVIFEFLNKLVHYLDRPLSQQEHYNLYNSLLKINMYAFFFPQKGLFLPLNQRFDYLKSSYSSLLDYDQFYNSLYANAEKFKILKNNPNLYQKYLLLLIDNLDIKTFYPSIKIALITTESQNINTIYRKKIQSLTQSTICFKDNLLEDVDLIVSYPLLHFSADTNYFVLNNPATSWDWGRLKLELEHIQYKKRKKLEQFQDGSVHTRNLVDNIGKA